MEERCRSFEEDLSAFVDGELDAARDAALRAHAAACAACSARVEQLRAVDTALRDAALASRELDAARVEALRERVASRLDADREPTDPLRARRAPRRSRRWVAPFAAGSLAGAAAATLVWLVQPSPPPPQIAAPERVAAAPAADAMARAQARVAAQEAPDAFAGRGASAESESEAPAPGDFGMIARYELIERLGALSASERSALDRDLARWRTMTPDERALLREQWLRLQALPPDARARLLPTP